MIRSFIKTFFLILVLVTAQLVLFACAGSQEIPESEKVYIEGVIVEGGVNGFRLKDDSGKIIRFYARGKVEYDPLDFHAYYGDRVGVTYFPQDKRGEDWHNALRVKMLTPNPNRIDFGSGSVDGIIRAKGSMRYLIYLPKYDLTIALYYKQNAIYSPKNWTKKTGNKVRVLFSEVSGRFIKKLYYNRIDRLGEDLVTIQDKAGTGVVTEIFVHRSVKKAPDRFAFKMDKGNTLRMYGGGETVLVPENLKVKIGKRYSIQYYPLLTGDQSLRYVATWISPR